MQCKVNHQLKYIFLAFVFVLFCAVDAAAQKNFASAKLDSVKLKIGDQTFLTLSIETPAGSKIKFQQLADTINAHIEIVSQTKIDTSFSADKQRTTFSKRILLTSFDSGYFAIAPFSFIVNEDTANPVYTEPLLIQIQTVSVDTTQAIRDIKGPKDAPWNIKEIVPYLIGGAVALLLVAFLIYYFKKRKVKPAVVIEKKPEIPAHIIALQQLHNLQSEKLWQEGKYKMYQIRLSDIVRVYIEGRFHINAMEQTTDETMRSFRAVNLPEELRFKLKQVLVLSDMVKFAKEQPLPAENEKSMEDALAFVNATAAFMEEERKETKA